MEVCLDLLEERLVYPGATELVRHGGQIRADSAPGAGASFAFTLPDRGKP